VRNRPVLGIRMSLPPLSRQPDAERAEAHLGQDPLRVSQRNLLDLRVPALSEIPDALLALPSDDRDLTLRRQDLEHQPHLPRSPPLVVLTLEGGAILDLTRQERAAPFELAEDVAPEGTVLVQ